MDLGLLQERDAALARGLGGGLGLEGGGGVEAEMDEIDGLHRLLLAQVSR